MAMSGRKIVGVLMLFFGVIFLLMALGARSANGVFLFISVLLIASGIYFFKKKFIAIEQPPSSNQQILPIESEGTFKDINKKEKVFKNVGYKGGFSGIEAGIFKTSKLHLCALPEGIAFYDVRSSERRAIIPWERLFKIETTSGMSDFGTSLVTGSFVKSRGFSDGLATGILAGVLEKNALVFHIKQNENDNFIQEVKFDDTRNEKIKTQIMAKRASLFPNGVNQTNSAGRDSSRSDDTISQISKLSALKDQGVLTEGEFTEKKKELLGKI